MRGAAILRAEALAWAMASTFWIVGFVESMHIESAALAPAWEKSTWTDGHATFYGSEEGYGSSEEPMGGACGYPDMKRFGYGIHNTAASPALLNGGLTCGACFELKCKVSKDPVWCFSNAPSVVVTVTNECPEDLSKANDNGGWCNRPLAHFDLAYPMFKKLARPVAGIIPVSYRRVQCSKRGGVRFTIDVQSNAWWTLVLVSNVGGGGDLAALGVRGSSRNRWMKMSHSWGAKWGITSPHPFSLQEERLSFAVTLGSGHKLITNNVVPPGWRYGETYQAPTNFQL